jgi:MFS transporter, ACS family, hexuronate transporter
MRAPWPSSRSFVLEAPHLKRPIKNLRWYMAGLLCLSSELNYLDRQTLSVLASTIQKDLGFSTIDYSRITAAFLFSYTVMYAVSGRLMDYLGTRRGLMIFVSGWSLANMAHALARTATHLVGYRILLGATEAAVIPAGVKAVSEWFPVKERALAVGIFNAGTAIGSAIAAPLVSAIALRYGWRAAFVITGALGFVWVALWAIAYRLPGVHPRLAEAERQLILGGESEHEPAQAGVPVARLLRMPEAWACILARVCTDPISYFLNFWIPKFLQEERGFTLAQVGQFVWIPFVALAVGNLASGAIPRLLIARGWPLDRARKRTMLAVSCAMPVLCLLVTQVQSPALAVAVVAGLMFGHAAWGNITLPAELFPRHVVATVTGLGGALGGLAGALTQLGIGVVVARFSFTPVFAVCSVMYLVAFLCVHRLAGELGRIREIPAR